MDRLVRRAVLFDYYGELLNEKQKKIVGYTVTEDMSLSEIGEMEGITRQAASVLLKRADDRLEEFEKKLRIVEKTGTIRSCLDRIKQSDDIGYIRSQLTEIEAVIELN